MILKSILIDDDPLCLKLLERYCQKMNNVEVVGVYTSGEAAIENFSSTTDLIFLDIEMPDGISGMEFLDQLPVVPNFIFTTFNPDYALDAFQYGAIDYLVKPIPFPRFTQAIEKASLVIKPANVQTQAPIDDHLFVKDKGQLIRLNIRDILYFENIKDYVMIWTNTGKYIIYSTLKAVLAKLPVEHFLKVHRTYIVNFNKIENIEENSLVIGNKLIPISKANKPILMNRLKLL